MMSLEQSFIAAAAEGRRLAGARGSVRTWVQIEAQARRLAHLIREAGFQIQKSEQLREKHILAVFSELRARGTAIGTLQNYARTARLVLQGAGKSKSAERLSNQALGASGRSRDGTKTAMREDTLAKVRTAIGDTKDRARAERLAIAVELARLAGLREQEVLLAGPSLIAWERSLARDGVLQVRLGTKGGRDRVVHIPASSRAELLDVITRARVVVKEGHFWPWGRGLKNSLRSFSKACARVGLTGQQSFHSLRYAFARAQQAHYMQVGYSERAANSLVSRDLGHGDGRGRYVRQVYLT